MLALAASTAPTRDVSAAGALGPVAAFGLNELEAASALPESPMWLTDSRSTRPASATSASARLAGTLRARGEVGVDELYRPGSLTDGGGAPFG
jgi:hypothetical protein